MVSSILIITIDSAHNFRAKIGALLLDNFMSPEQDGAPFTNQIEGLFGLEVVIMRESFMPVFKYFAKLIALAYEQKKYSDLQRICYDVWQRLIV